MNGNEVFRPRANLFWGYSALVLDALFLVQAFAFPAKTENLLFDIFIALLVAAAAILMWIRPKLLLGESQLVVVNPVKRVVIDYKDITELETKWALLIKHQGKSTRVWVAPSNGKQRWVTDSTNRWRFGKLPQTSGTIGEAVPISSSNLSDSGAAATLIRQRMQSKH